VAGVDGARHGWVVAVVDTGGVRWRTAGDAAGVLEATDGCVAVGVDIPLGLPAGAARRPCDELAAARLGPARSSVFPAPPRPVLAARTHPEACAVAKRLTGRAISLQTFHIGPKVAEWEAVDLPDAVVEVHPELAFRALAPEVVFASKRTVRGAGQRIAALARWVDAGRALADLPAGVGMDDLLDALAAAWSASRWAAGRAEVLGGEIDERGRAMRVVI
jgi:predicted RNase H-like nuclease